MFYVPTWRFACVLNKCVCHFYKMVVGYRKFLGEMSRHGMRHVVREILNKYEQDDVASKGEDIGMTVDRDIWRKVAF